METLKERLLPAVRNGNLETVKSYLELFVRKDIVEFQDEDDRNFLQIAVNHKQIEVAEFILKLYDVNGPYKPSRDYSTDLSLLIFAVVDTDKEMVKFLLSHGADPNYTIQIPMEDAQGYTLNALVCASQFGYVEIVKILLEAGARFFISDNEWSRYWSKIITTHIKERHQVLEVLMNFGIDKARITRRIFCLGVDCTDIEYVNMLLDQGVDIESTYRGETALCLAVYSFSAKMVRLLLDRGANIHNYSRNGSQFTPLHVSANGPYREDIGKLLIKRGANPNSLSNDGQTPLHFAVKNGVDELVELFLEQGADINPRIDTGSDCAVELDVVKLAIKSGELDAGEILVKYVVKMQAENLYVSKNNLEAIAGNERLKSRKEDCEKEIKKLKETEFSETVFSLYDLLKTNTLDQLAIYAKNKQIEDLLKSDGFQNEFPIYGNMIRQQFQKGVERKVLLIRVCNFFRSLYARADCKLPNLPSVCVNLIFGYLSNKDLNNLRDAYF